MFIYLLIPFLVGGSTTAETHLSRNVLEKLSSLKMLQHREEVKRLVPEEVVDLHHERVVQLF